MARAVGRKERAIAMADWIRWTAPAAVAATISAPAQAVQYLSVGAAQKLAFPSAQFVEVQAGRVWKAESGGRLVGYFVFDRVIGKHLYIDYAVALEPGGRIRRVDILQYRESYGDEVRGASWLAQFVGKSSANPLQVGNDIRNISGATLSSHHVTEGVKRIVNLARSLR
jgi:Na+-translocating ferredoxin:NAD+ oxidoreductase RnfG subunit